MAETRDFFPNKQGKSLSLICASLTWLRHHKSNQHETAIQAASKELKDEPNWIIEQLLRGKREELARRWEDREKRLAAVRLKEKALEDRARKRRRLSDDGGSYPATFGRGRQQRQEVDDEEAEWLVSDPSDRSAGQGDALSGLSKESRDILTKIGLKGHKGGGGAAAGEDEEILEEGVKVRTRATLLHVFFKANSQSNAFPVSCRSTIPRERILNCLNLSPNFVDRPFHLLFPNP
jgi:chromosome transmission fidelity protein 1